MLAPEFMPVLAVGSHANPREGACIMEYVSYLAGEHFSDTPECTDPVLAGIARAFNDAYSDDMRHVMLPFIPRLMGTALPLLQYRAVHDTMRVWVVRRALPYLPPGKYRVLGALAIEACAARGEAMYRYADLFRGSYDYAGLGDPAATAKRIFYGALRPLNSSLVDALTYVPWMEQMAPEQIAPYFTSILDMFDAAAGRTPAPPLTDETLLRCHELTAP